MVGAGYSEATIVVLLLLININRLNTVIYRLLVQQGLAIAPTVVLVANEGLVKPLCGLGLIAMF